MRILIYLVLFSSTAALAAVPNVRQSSLGTGSCTFDKPTLAGSQVATFFHWQTSTNTPSVTDSLLTSLSQNKFDTAHTLKVAYYSGITAGGGSDTFTIAVAGATALASYCFELTGVPGTLDASSTVTTFSATGTITTSAVVTTKNIDLLVACAGGNNSFMKSVLPFNSLGDFAAAGIGGACEFRLAGAVGSYTASFVSPNATAGSMFVLAFSAPALNIATTTLPDGKNGTAYNFCIPYAGGIGPLTWSILSGTPQTGLSLDASTGCISGTPSVSSTVTLDIQVTDGTTTTHQGSLSLKIAGSLNTLAIVQTTAIAAGGGTFSSSAIIGDLILLQLAAGSNRSGRITACTDTQNTVYTYISSVSSYKTSGLNSGTQGSQFMLGTVTSTGSNHISCGDTSSRGQATEISNAYLASDNFGITTGTGTSATSNNLTTLVPSETLFSMATAETFNDAATVQSPFTVLGTSTQPGAGYLAATTVTTYSVTYAISTSADWGIILAGLRPTGGAVAPATPVQHRARIN